MDGYCPILPFPVASHCAVLSTLYLLIGVPKDQPPNSKP
jgi:hypothetical protein